jgi:hypothetical protein
MQLEDLLGRGYFPKELPRCFTTHLFANYISANHPVRVHGRNRTKTLVTRAATHNLARPGNQRRRLSIPHPHNYYLLCNELVNNWSTVDAHLQKSAITLTRPVADPNQQRGVVPTNDGGELPGKRAAFRATATHLVRTDISRWYHSIYTHSIPWALDGKAAAKQTRHGGLGNTLDFFIRNAQDQQTLGIPVGPDASFIISEIIGTAIDEGLSARGLRGFRFMDDFEFSAASLAEAEQALPIIEQVLQDFELATNPAKTSVEQLPRPLDREWSMALRSYELPTQPSAGELIKYFDDAFSLRERFPTETVLGYALSRLRTHSIPIAQWELFRDLLFQCAIVEPGTLSFVLWHLGHSGPAHMRDGFDTVLERILQVHAPLGHGSEVAWALWAAIWSQTPISSDVAALITSSEDAVVALLALHARSLGRISLPLDVSQWEQMMTADSIYNGNWLLAYEADVQGWLPSADRRNHIDGDPNLSQLKAAGVTFYDVGAVTSAVDPYDVIDVYGAAEPPKVDFAELFGDGIDDDDKLPF